MTPDEIAAIRARADAATPGPWSWAVVPKHRVFPFPARRRARR